MIPSVARWVWPGLLALGLLSATPRPALAASDATEAAVTVLADFEDDVVAAVITDVEQILAADCSLRRVSIPARGTASLALALGATKPNASAAFHLTFREAARFDSLESVAALVWINENTAQVSFRLRDARGELFETAAQTVAQHHRWIRIVAPVGPSALRAVRGGGPPRFPLRLDGARVALRQPGKQTVFLDDLQIEHRVAPRELVRADFQLSEPTRIVEPGATIGAVVEFENRSRRRALNLSVELTWRGPAGVPVHTQRATVALPASGSDFRSRQRLDYSHRLHDPGLYRLVAQVSAAGWSAPASFETAVAVTPSNRQLRRGRSTFFGIAANLLRESLVDQRLELALARDLGADLLAIEVPRKAIEPRGGVYDFTALDPVIDGLARADIVPLVMLTSPIEGAGEAPGPLVDLLQALGRRYGDKLQRFLLTGEVLGRQTAAEQFEEVGAITRTLATALPRAQVWPPPLRLAAGAPSAAQVELARAWSGPLMLATGGATAEAVAAARGFQEQAGLPRRDTPVYWLHESPGAAGLGTEVDAVAVLRHFVQAAESGASGLIWHELRDVDLEQASSEPLHGLVRRDFSPRASLLGFAAVSGELTGLGYKGPVLNAPEECDSALFIGSDRQIAVLIPRPQRVLPALLAPLRGVEGELEFRGLDRRPRELLHTAEYPLIVTAPDAMFLRLLLSSPQPEPQLGFLQPWLRCPETVFCGGGAAFTIEVEAPRAFSQGFLQLEPRSDAPFSSDFSAAGLRMNAGDSVRHTVTLTPRRPFTESAATLNVSLEDSRFSVPLRVLRLFEVLPAEPAAPLSAADRRLDETVAAEPRRDRPRLAIQADWSPRELRLGLVLSGAAERPASLRVAAVREGGPAPVGIRLDALDGVPSPAALFPSSAEAAAAWRVSHEPAADGPGRRMLVVTIPAASLGSGGLNHGDRLLLAVRYAELDAEGDPGAVLEWGQGLAEGSATRAYRWIRLSERR